MKTRSCDLWKDLRDAVPRLGSRGYSEVIYMKAISQITEVENVLIQKGILDSTFDCSSGKSSMSPN